jgi:transcription factor SPN1
MSEGGSPAGERANDPIDDGQEREYDDAVAAADSDRESDALSEVDEDQFEDYDPETANIEDRPVDIDEDVARTLKATKRKRTEGEVSKKPREGRRDKKRRDRDEDVVMDDADGGKKPRRSRRAADGEGRPRAKAATPEADKEENLTPEERQKRAIDRALDAAIKKPSGPKRRKKDEIVCFYSGRFWRRMWLTLVSSRTSKTNSTTCWQISRSEWSRHARQTIVLVSLASLLSTSSSCSPKSPAF